MVHIPCDYGPTIQALSTWSYLASTNNNVYRQNSPTEVKSDDHQTESANTQGGILAFPVCSSFLPGYSCTKTRHSGWIIQQTNLSSVPFATFFTHLNCLFHKFRIDLLWTNLCYIRRPRTSTALEPLPGHLLHYQLPWLVVRITQWNGGSSTVRLILRMPFLVVRSAAARCVFP